jgi:hypothetical protein
MESSWSNLAVSHKTGTNLVSASKGYITNRTFLTRPSYVLVVFLLVVYVAPSINYQLPTYRSTLTEEYQPLQAFKFFATKGKAFHKYGPMGNFILAGPYAATIGYWKLTGQMRGFSSEFPFGLTDPLGQFGILHMEGRIVFVVLSAFLYYFFCLRLEAITENPLIIATAFLVCVSTNLPLLIGVPVPGPDSALNGFAAAALGVYVTIIFKGLNSRRAFCVSLLAVCAISAKELAGPMFIFPYIGILWTEWRRVSSQDDRRRLLKSAVVLMVTGVGAYVLLNIAYAPHTWLERMRFWLSGPGIDPAVWGDTTTFERLRGMALCVLDNLGPGGAILAIGSLVLFLVRRPTHWLLLSLPTLSLFVLGLGRMGYQEDRFYTLAVISLCPMVVAGLSVGVDELRATALAKPIVIATGVLVGVNVLYGTAAWLFLSQKSSTLMEQEVRSEACPHALVWVFDMFPEHDASRYNMLGYKFDGRSANQILQSPRDQLPEIAMSTVSEMEFLEDARKMQARADMFKSEAGFDLANWRGIKALGYSKVVTIVPRLPRWFPFGWMPTVKTFIARNAVVVYSRPCSQIGNSRRADAFLISN